jgi:hypothetical protein
VQNWSSHGNDAKATLRTVLEEDENLLFVPLTDDQLGLLFDNYPKIRAKYEFHDSNPSILSLIRPLAEHRFLLLADSHRFFTLPVTS